MEGWPHAQHGVVQGMARAYVALFCSSCWRSERWSSSACWAVFSQRRAAALRSLVQRLTGGVRNGRERR